MNWLYIAEDYIGSRVHHNLCQAIVAQNPDIQLTVFSLKRDGYGSRDLRSSFGELNYKAAVANFDGNSLMYKVLFPYKIEQKYKALQAAVEIEKIDFIFAATLFSEGAVALKLYQEHHIPYIVVVRGSDVNFYFQKMPHLRKIGRDIVRYAHKIIFITPSFYTTSLEAPALKPVAEIMKSKSVIIKNGIDDIWIDNTYFDNSNRVANSVLYVGNFGSNKNVMTLIQSCKLLKKTCPDLTLNLVGGGGSQEKEVLEIVTQEKDWIHFYGPIYDKKELMKIYRQNTIFAMVSHSETFGLVYLEALSQGLPVIYTRDQGFGGLFKNNTVGYAVSPNREKEIAQKIKLALKNCDQLVNKIKQLDFEEYRWNTIAKRWIATTTDMTAESPKNQ